MRFNQLQLTVRDNLSPTVFKLCVQWGQGYFPSQKNGIGYTKTCICCATNKALKRAAKGKEKESTELPGTRNKAPYKLITTSGLQLQH